MTSAKVSLPPGRTLQDKIKKVIKSVDETNFRQERKLEIRNHFIIGINILAPEKISVPAF